MHGTTEQRLRQHAVDDPSAPAVSSFHRRLTAEELDHDADRVASYLTSRGLPPGARVAFLGRNRVEVPAVLVGTRRTRTAFVGVNFRLNAHEIAAALRVVRPDVVITEPRLVASLAEWRSTADHEPHVAVLGEEDGETPWGDLEDVAVVSRDVADPEPDDVAMIYFTAGTSGSPKAVVHRLAACEMAASLYAELGIGADTTQLIVPPTFHVAGALWSQFSVHARSHQVLLSDAAPSDLLTAIEQFGVTHAVFVPTLIKILLDALDAAGDATSDHAGDRAPSMETLRMVAYGASPIPPSLLDRAIERLGCDFYQAYGMTEMNGVVSRLLPVDHRPAPEHTVRLRSAGQAVQETEVRVVEPVTSTVLAAGVDGELQFRGPLCMVGYLDDSDATAAAITDDGFFRSGDVGHLDDDGYLYITDRISDTIITGGENVYPAEVEDVIVELATVAEAAVVGVPDETWGERIVAALVAEPGASIDVDAVDAHCRDRLAGYKRPREYVIVDELPRNAAGKIIRRDVSAGWS